MLVPDVLSTLRGNDYTLSKSPRAPFGFICTGVHSPKKLFSLRSFRNLIFIWYQDLEKIGEKYTPRRNNCMGKRWIADEFNEIPLLTSDSRKFLLFVSGVKNEETKQ